MNRVGARRTRDDTSEEQSVEQQVQGLWCARKQVFTKKAFFFVLILFFFIALCQLIQLLSGHRLKATNAQEIIIFGVLLVLVFFQICPHLLGTPCLHVLHLTLQLALVMFNSRFTGTTFDNFLRTSRSQFVIRWIVSFLPMDFKHAWFASCMASVGNVLIYASYDQDREENLRFVMFEFVAFMALGLCVFLFETSCIDCIAEEAKAKSSHEQERPVTALLNVLCSAVVELDEDLVLCNHSATFSNLLFFGFGRDMKGAKLEEFVVLEDKATFQKHFQNYNGQMPNANNFRVRFRDAWGSAVSLELMVVKLQAVDRRVKHLVGLVEADHVEESQISEYASKDVEVLQKAPVCAGRNMCSVAQCMSQSVSQGYAIVDPDNKMNPVVSNQPLGSLQIADRNPSNAEKGIDRTPMRIEVIANTLLPITCATESFRREFGCVQEFAKLVDDPESFCGWIIQSAAMSLNTGTSQRTRRTVSVGPDGKRLRRNLSVSFAPLDPGGIFKGYGLVAISISSATLTRTRSLSVNASESVANISLSTTSVSSRKSCYNDGNPLSDSEQHSSDSDDACARPYSARARMPDRISL